MPSNLIATGLRGRVQRRGDAATPAAARRSSFRSVPFLRPTGQSLRDGGDRQEQTCPGRRPNRWGVERDAGQRQGRRTALAPIPPRPTLHIPSQRLLAVQLQGGKPASETRLPRGRSTLRGARVPLPPGVSVDRNCGGCRIPPQRLHGNPLRRRVGPATPRKGESFSQTAASRSRRVATSGACGHSSGAAEIQCGGLPQRARGLGGGAEHAL